MQDNFEKALKFTLQYEGGYVNHPQDPGGPTNKGITQHTYNEYRKEKGLGVVSVAGISSPEVEEIYKNEYWDLIGADNLPQNLDIAAFDFAVNSGPRRALDYLQKAMLATNIPENRIKIYIDQREQFLRSLSTFPVFGHGWINRLNALRQFVGENNGKPV